MFLDNQKQKENHDLNTVKQRVQSFYNLQNRPQLQQLIKLNQFLLSNTTSEFQKEVPQPSPITPQQYEVFRRRCDRITNKNQKLKQSILIIKNKLKRQLNFSDRFESPSNLEEIQITQKLKLITTEIRGKILELKQKRYMNKQIAMKNQEFNLVQRRSKQKMIPVNLQMEQMKKGTEFMFRNLMSLKYDMEITEKYMKSHAQQKPKLQSKNRYY